MEATSMEYEIIKFENGNIELEVNVSPEEETVWLTQEQIALLFGKSRSTITEHINNIFDEGELEEMTSVGNSDRTNHRPAKLYNLDVVLAVGYRINSKNGIAFRRWANSVLKEYLLRGYALNEGRTLITKDNYLNLVNRVDSLDVRIGSIENAVKHRFVEDVIISDGEMFDALVLITKMIETAYSSIVLMDPYIDATSLSFFKNKKEGVTLVVITSSRANIGRREISSFSDRFGRIEIKIDDKCHDRYLVLDNELFYHLGCSINYIGKRLSQITLIKDEFVIDALRKRINTLCGNGD